MFAALWPSEEVLDAVDAAVDEALAADPDPDVWRVTGRERRHVTLRFHADADPAAVAAALRAASTGRPAPTLRCRGAGCFGDAIGLGVEADDPVRLAALVAAAGGDPGAHVAHLTVARGRRRRSTPAPSRARGVPPALAAHTGPWWTPREVVLVAGGGAYRVLERVPLTAGARRVGDA